MNFSEISPKSLLGKTLRISLKILPSNMKMPILQGHLRGSRWIVGSGNHGYWLGSHEYAKRRLFEKIISKGSIVFDIGAHVGFYTLLASKLVGSAGIVFAFEPMPRNLFFLKEHLSLNRCTNVSVIEAAVSNRTGTTLFDEGPHHSMGHISTQGSLTVKMVSLDELVLRGEIPVPDYVKIDVEGAELLVLTGAKTLLRSNHPAIFLDTHGHDIHRKCCGFLTSLNYKLQPIKGDSVNETNEILAQKS